MSSMTRRGVLAGMAMLGTSAVSADTSVGDVAPDFTLATTTGGNVRLSDYRGKSNVVLDFLPKAFTGG